MSNKVEYSESGSPIYRYEKVERQWQPPIYGDESLEKIEQHISKYIGEPKYVLHEIVSDIVHIDVHYIEPSDKRNYHTFVTTGMSLIPMNVPEGVENADNYRYSELMICLPPSWPVSNEAFKDHNNYWPIKWLKMLARFPYEYNTWLWWGHTMPNGDPAQQIAENNKFSGVIILPPIRVDSEFTSLEINKNKTIYFFSVVPLYEEEMNYKLKYGADALTEKFDKNGITELIDINRVNVCKKSLWPFKK